MLRRLIKRQRARGERGQVLIIFAAGLIAFLGFVAMSIDVGRLVWARTQIQAAVDAAALAAAQSMPDAPGATTKANEYWTNNSSFIRSQGENVQFDVTFPPGNKAIAVHGEADIPTWFARIFGLDHWHVSADGEAASQVLDIAIVADVSGSMCFDSFLQTESADYQYLMSPGRLSPVGGSFPKLTQAISGTANGPLTIRLNDISIFNSTDAGDNRSNFGTSWNSSTPYWKKSISGRAGMIMIDKELFRITGVNASTNTLTVDRAQKNNNTGIYTVKAAHSAGAEVWANRTGYGSTSNYCELASYYKATPSQKGPEMPFDGAISSAQYFTTLFNPLYDKIGLVKYSTTATSLKSLTSNFGTVTSAMDDILYPTGGTNIAHGISTGVSIVDGSGKRANAVKVVVLLTDGIPTNYCSNASAYTGGSSCSAANDSTPNSCPASTTAISHAKAQAAAAKEAGALVFTIGLGHDVLDCVLQDIADAGGGKYYKAPTTAQLNDAFKAVAEQTHIALTK